MTQDTRWPIHTIPTFRAFVGTDELEGQAAGGGESIRGNVQSIADLGGPPGPPGPEGPQMFPNLKLPPYNAVGDGSTDDTAAVRAFFADIGNATGYVPAGTYLTNSFTVKSGTTVFGDSPDASIFLAIDTLPTTSALAQNEHPFPDESNTYDDEGITFYNIGFDGNNLGTEPDTRVNPLINFMATKDSLFLNVMVRNIKFIALGVFNGLNSKITNCQFYNTGSLPEGPSNAGAAVWISSSLGNQNIGTKVIGCHFDRIHSAAILCSGSIGTIIQGNVFTNIDGTCMYCPWPNTQMLIDGNSINLVISTAVAYDPGSGIDCGGSKITITNNMINYTSGPSLNFQSATQVVISGNLLMTPSQALVPEGVVYGAISWLSMDISQFVFNPRYISITGNTILNEGSQGAIGIAFSGQNLPSGPITIANGGSGWAVGHVATISGGDGNATCYISAESGGVATTVLLLYPGSGYSTASGVATTGAGAGLTLNIVASGGNIFTVGPLVATLPGAQLQIAGAGTGYAVNDTGVILGGGGNATYKVYSVFDGGAVHEVQLIFGGTGYKNAFSVATATGGGQPGVGTGLQLNVTIGGFGQCFAFQDVAIVGNVVSGTAWAGDGSLVIGDANIFGGDPDVTVAGDNFIAKANTGILDYP